MNSDQVQERIEGFIQKLKGGVVEGLINREEMKSILKKRNDFEYSLARNQVTLEDYQLYLTYELQLEKLRKKRRERLLSSNASHSDNLFIENIIRLYKIIVQKYRNVEKIREQIEFCKANKLTKQLREAFQAAITLFPRREEFWLEAANFESAPEAKRTIYQRALRMNSESKLLWLEFCKSQLKFGTSLIKKKMKEKGDPTIQKVPFVIFKQAIQVAKLSQDLQFKIQFLQLFEEYSKKLNVEDSKNEIESLIKNESDLTSNSSISGLVDKRDHLEKVIQSSQDKSNAYREFVAYYLSKMSTDKEAIESSERILKLFEDIEQKGEWSPQLSIQFIDFLIGLGEIQKAIQELEKVSESYPSSIEFWKYKTSLRARLLALLEHKVDPVIPKLKKADVEVWLRLLEYSIIIGLPFQTIFENFQRVMLLFSKNSKEQNGLVRLADMVHTRFGEEAFKSICECALKHTIPLPMLMKWIVYERQHPSPSKKTIRKLFEKGCSEWGKSSEDLWIEYWQFENEANDGQSGNIYWKAKRTLSNPTKFIQRTVNTNHI
eukprot:TRINITY_DN1323_c0_g1_i2.p1 TRINITY_DN1323_c0_g1~~TRINITY_DN1323_c0_g1_i2.p1  ORF type:complete len:548 (-),score=144.64 TRINITY_DN1323_c0_g1_i2:23-1666(-)